MAYFVFKGVSSVGKGIQVTRIDIPQRAATGSDVLPIPGRPEPLVRSKDVRDLIDIRIEAELSATVDMRDIYSWLTGEGDLILSDEPAKVYHAYAYGPISTTRVNGCYRTLAIALRCAPFAYAISNDPISITDNPYYFLVGGSECAEPYIELTGVSDDISIIVNGVLLVITGLTGDIYIDVPRRMVYQINTSGDKVVKNQNTSGNLWDMKLVPSSTDYNRIQWVSDAVPSSVKLTKNERWM